MKVLQTQTFIKQCKKLHSNQKKDLDGAITLLMINPIAGDSKKGDLSGIRVYKFFMIKQQMLLAYEYHDADSCLILLSLGSHENFYRDLKNK